jgi:hypothetical protein
MYTGIFQRHPANPEQTMRFYEFGDISVHGPADGSGAYGSLAKRSILQDGALCNISFLRLVGLSSPEGRDLSITGVFPLDVVQQWVDNASTFTRILYRTHMAPFDFCVTTTIDRTMRIDGD